MTITQIAHVLQNLLGPVSNQLALQTGFTRRSSKVTGSVFVQSLVFSSLHTPRFGYRELVTQAGIAGVTVSKQGLEQRFSARSAALLRGVLERAVQVVIQTQPAALPLLNRFTGVYLRDSTIIGLPQALEDLWPGSGSSHGRSAGLKLHTRLELLSGQLGGPVLAPARQHDRRSPFQDEQVPPGALRLADLGFFSLQQLVDDDRRGVFWLTRYKTGVLLADEAGQPIELLTWLRQQTAVQVERRVRIGQAQFPCRLLVERVPPAVVEQRRRKLHEYARKKQTPVSAELLALAEWTLLLTNLPAEPFPIADVLVLLHVRWQIELLFKRWKSLLAIDEWRSTDPWRILTELYAKLLAALIAHWCVLTRAWSAPRLSLWQATQLVQQFAPLLALALPDFTTLLSCLTFIESQILTHCRLQPRRRRPALFQLLENPSCISLA